MSYRIRLKGIDVSLDDFELHPSEHDHHDHHHSLDDHEHHHDHEHAHSHDHDHTEEHHHHHEHRGLPEILAIIRSGGLTPGARALAERIFQILAEAEAKGVKSVPALLTPNGNVLHLNFGASMADVKG